MHAKCRIPAKGAAMALLLMTACPGRENTSADEPLSSGVTPAQPAPSAPSASDAGPEPAAVAPGATEPEDACACPVEPGLEAHVSLECLASFSDLPAYDEVTLVDSCMRPRVPTWTRTTGCGRVVVTFDGGLGGVEYTFDAATHELVGAHQSSDVGFGPCNRNHYIAGEESSECDDATACSLCEGDADACEPEPALEPPSCLSALMDACPGFEGTCRSQLSDAGPSEADCYDSGARIEHVWDGDGCAGSRHAQRVIGSDGALCFTLETTTDLGTSCESGHYTWRDPSGNTIATGTYGSIATSIECSAGGDSVSCDAPGCPRDPLFGHRECETAECSAQ